MAAELPAASAALPVLKVLYRNTSRIHATGGAAKEVLHPIAENAIGRCRACRRAHSRGGSRQESRSRRTTAWPPQHRALARRGVQRFAAGGGRRRRSASHRPGLSRLGSVGPGWARARRDHVAAVVALLRRQLQAELRRSLCRHSRAAAQIARSVPAGRARAGHARGRRCLDRIDVRTRSSPRRPTRPRTPSPPRWPKASAPHPVADADRAWRANQLVLRDAGRLARNAQPNKPVGSVHGDSIGVHACDSVNAWRNIAAVSNRRNAVASLILSAWQVASDRGFGGSEILAAQPQPEPQQIEKITVRDRLRLLARAGRCHPSAGSGPCLRRGACLRRARLPGRPVQDLLLRYAISEDGALHAEKFYSTTNEEFARARPKFRWRAIGRPGPRHGQRIWPARARRGRSASPA